MQLNSSQMEAVTADQARVCVVASPGSGKTTVVVERIRHMLHTLQVIPSHIHALTFTRLAANQFAARLGRDAQGLGFIGTVHAYCLQLVMQHGQAIGYDPAWLRLIGDGENCADEMQALVDLGYCRQAKTGKTKWVKCKAGEWHTYKDQVLAGKMHPGDWPDLQPAWDGFMGNLRNQNTLTYSSLLYETSRLLSLSNVLAAVCRTHQHILVDEFQDTDPQQWQIISSIVGGQQASTLMVVGDPDQSIYAWRGADPAIMLEFANRPSVHLVQLRECYRYGQDIANASCSLIDHNTGRLQQPVVALGPCGSVTVQEDAEQPSRLLELCASHKPRDVAVLCRMHAPLHKIQQLLEAQGVPCLKLGTLHALKQTAEWQACVGLLRLSINPADRLAFMAAACALGLDADGLHRVRATAARHRSSLWHAWAGRGPSQQGTRQPPSTVAALADFLAGAQGSNYASSLMHLAHVDHAQGSTDTQALLNYLAYASVQDELQGAQDGDGSVTLATMHAAKGLQWPVVILIGMTQGICPSQSAVRKGSMEEDRRLCFVGMTRAQKSLHLVSWDCNYTQAPASQFIEEAGLTGALIME